MARARTHTDTRSVGLPWTRDWVFVLWVCYRRIRTFLPAGVELRYQIVVLTIYSVVFSYVSTLNEHICIRRVAERVKSDKTVQHVAYSKNQWISISQHIHQLSLGIWRC